MSGFIKAEEIQEKNLSRMKLGCIQTMTLVGKLDYSE